MSVTILEALQNAKINLCDKIMISIQVDIGKEQLKNAVTLLEKGYALSDEVEPLLEEYGNIESVPDIV